ncbi:DUF4055 domain-containing protein [Chelatococcus asaccharovorans]|uniref:Uncharacterized protein DUF4055 n=1 Tax=Chelatococcus asaccharovorans TaxID=28210 RepID=A0A2V3UB21_9HYPH|nr:DUF4055 domain-containing protein [Chelatococcus asaccharovorans]MBS7703303.1 DUF4055 domain-containing protein [Chelatococcus asaccharovorans]PXW61637.1 uncharacterized protein DUF4055 [Chelatococcus asaccharovorans]
MSANPLTPGIAQQDLADDWRLIAGLLKGAKALRTPEYLPQYEAETDAAYAARKSRSFLYPAFRLAVRNITGRVFAKPLSMSEDMPEIVDGWTEDIDLRGNSLDRFARTFFADALAFGQSHILVDYTDVPAEADALTERQLEPRPYWMHVPALNLLAADATRIGGKMVCTYARILESETIREGFVQKRVPVVRELEPGLVRLWKPDGKGAWAIADERPMTIRGRPLSSVPLISYFAGEMEDDYTAAPPLLELANKNLEHFQSASDQRNILTFARFPMLALSGSTAQEVDSDGHPKPFVVGPRKVLQTPDANGKWYYVEPQGNAIQAGHQDLETLKVEMKALGMEPLLPTTGNVTATFNAISMAEAHSAAQAMSFAMKDALDQALVVTGLWAGIDEPGFVMVNADFQLGTGEAERIKAILDLRGRGDLSRLTTYEEMQRMGVLSADFDADEEDSRLASEPDFQMGGLDGGVEPEPADPEGDDA